MRLQGEGSLGHRMSTMRRGHVTIERHMQPSQVRGSGDSLLPAIQTLPGKYGRWFRVLAGIPQTRSMFIFTDPLIVV